MAAKKTVQQVAEDIVEDKRKAANVDQCVVCGNDSDMFLSPGKRPHGKYVCPDCVAII